MNLNIDEYLDSVLGCWLGKNIGGTVGAPFEWIRQVNQVSFYTQDLGGEPLPNDDLDIQLLWLVALEEQGLEIDAHLLSEYWLLYVTPHWSEYGIAKANLRRGLLPPLSGTLGNPMKDSCGAFIRSEIWACIAPGSPQLAARYAYEDAIIDHGDGEGTYAEVFCAAMESAAFVVKDIPTLIQIGLSYIPESCGVAGAVKLALEQYRSGAAWRDARDEMLYQFRGSAPFHDLNRVADEDRARGFAEGKFGWDVPSNIGMLLIGLLYGEGDFARSICTAVNCGEDTDCTAATAGSLFGILHGARSIPDEWVAPIGRKIRTACLNLGELGYFGNQLPADIDDLTARTAKISAQLGARGKLGIQVSAQPTEIGGMDVQNWLAGGLREQLFAHLNGPLFHFHNFDVYVDYGAGGPLLRPGEAKTIRLVVENRYKVQTGLALHWYAPEDWQIGPARDLSLLSLPASYRMGGEAIFTVTVERPQASTLRAAVEISKAGWPETFLAPILLLNG